MYSRYYFLLNSFLFCVLQQTSCWFSENCPPLPFLICSNVFPLILFSLCFYFILFYFVLSLHLVCFILFLRVTLFHSVFLLYPSYRCFLLPFVPFYSSAGFFFLSFFFFHPSHPVSEQTFFFPFSARSFVHRTHSFSTKASVPFSLPSPSSQPLFYRSTIISRVIQGNTDATNDFYQSWKRSSVIWLSFCDLHHLQRSTCPPFRLARSPWSRYSFTSLHYPSPSVK